MAGYRGGKINPRRFEKGQIKIYVALLPIALFMLLPIIFIICHAFKPMEELFAFPPQFIVKNPTFDNFRKLFKTASSSGIPLSRYVFNSVLVTGLTVFLSIIMSSMAGFALSKMKFKLKGTLMEINNLALMFVAVAVQIPRYLIIDGMALTNTYWAHILPLIAMPVNLFLIKQFIDGVPDALIEAAVIDGASNFRVYHKIILPLIKPALATGALLAFQQAWNNIESSNLFVTSDGLKTLAFYMNTVANVNTAVAGQGIAAAASLIMFLPNLILFIILQKNVMNTMANSGIK